MELFFSPLACSLATRITLYEAGGSAQFTQVDLKTKRLADGTDFRSINPLGQVPVLRTDTGELLTENPVVLQYVADRHPQSGLAPAAGMERYALQQWLGFVTSELHKLVFSPLLNAGDNEGAKAFAIQSATSRLDHLNKHLDGREFLLDRFTIADAYLTTVLNWASITPIDLTQWPAVHAYQRRMHARPAVAKAFNEEMALYQALQARRTAA